MITSRWVKGKEELEEILELRKKIFGENSDLEFYDEFSFNLGIYENDDNLVGIGRLLSKEGKFYIDNFGVKKDFQGKHYGDFMLRILI
ncbi:MAG: GNAT family N-acetyltransferase, partial [Bacillota bacterium]|nr:GNAT family N-acetyltransferase [Bacillota bacterium]